MGSGAAARQDSNLQPDRYERQKPAAISLKAATIVALSPRLCASFPFVSEAKLRRSLHIVLRVVQRPGYWLEYPLPHKSEPPREQQYANQPKSNPPPQTRLPLYRFRDF